MDRKVKMAPNLDVKEYVWSILEKLASLFDGVTNSIKIVEYEHHEIHAGSHYFYRDKNEIASGSTQDYIVYAPHSSKHIHFVYTVDGSAITQFDLYEETDRLGTTLQNTFNSDRNSSNTPGMKVYKGQSGGTTDGTLLKTYKGGAAAQQSRQGSMIRATEEIVLKENTKYLIRITSGTNNNLTNVLFTWYEHTSNV